MNNFKISVKIKNRSLKSRSLERILRVVMRMWPKKKKKKRERECGLNIWLCDLTLSTGRT